MFCRNVLIHFAKKTKAAVIEKIAEVLLPDGALLLGHAESVNGLASSFVQIEHAQARM